MTRLVPCLEYSIASKPYVLKGHIMIRTSHFGYLRNVSLTEISRRFNHAQKTCNTRMARIYAKAFNERKLMPLALP